MNTKSSPTVQIVFVRAVPIALCALIKYAGLAESGGAAKQMVADGEVKVNGVVERQKRKQLAEGDRVMVGLTTVVVRLEES